ncbi:MAG: radical SAM protein [Pseudomonadota bacterium]
MGKGVRSHQVESALAEVRYLVEERGVRHFEVLDDDLLATPAVTSRFLEGLIPLRQSHSITWSANNGLITNSLTKELVELMKDSGCIGFKIGVEAGNNQMLRKMKKPGTPATFKKIAAFLQDYPDFFVGGNYIIGLFGEETFDQMLQTYRLSIELNLDWSSFSLYQATSKATTVDKPKGGSGGAIDFIPTKSTANRELQEDRSLPLGPDLFSLPGDLIPSQELMKNIWLTFNMVGNYIGNKNLAPGGDVVKFVRWVNALRISYPDNPYMALFAGLGQVIAGNPGQGLADHALCAAMLAHSDSWRYRFEEFQLSGLMQDFPRSRSDVYEALAQILTRYDMHG